MFNGNIINRVVSALEEKTMVFNSVYQEKDNTFDKFFLCNLFFIKDAND